MASSTGCLATSVPISHFSAPNPPEGERLSIPCMLALTPPRLGDEAKEVLKEMIEREAMPWLTEHTGITQIPTNAVTPDTQRITL